MNWTGALLVMAMIAGCERAAFSDRDVEAYAKSACERDIKNVLHDPEFKQLPPSDAFEVKTLVPRDSYEVRVTIPPKDPRNAPRAPTYKCTVTGLDFPGSGDVKWRSSVAKID